MIFYKVVIDKQLYKCYIINRRLHYPNTSQCVRVGDDRQTAYYCCIVQMGSACDLESQDNSSILFAAVKNKERGLKYEN